MRELEQIHANPPINWYCACRYQLVWVEFHVSMKGSHYTFIFACALFWVFGFGRMLACSHADFAGTDISFFLWNGSRTKLFETYFANSGDSPYYGYLF